MKDFYVFEFLELPAIIYKNFCWNLEQDLHILDVKYVSHSTKSISEWTWSFIIVY